jgi:PAS domain-containing protein
MACAGIAIGRRSTQLAQAVTSLYSEVARRKQFEQDLQQLNATLEQRAADRTATLRQANAQMHEEVKGRQKTQAALQESKDRLGAIIDTVVEGIITVDEHGFIESFNPAAERMFGHAAEEMIGQNVTLLMPSPYREEHDGPGGACGSEMRMPTDQLHRTGLGPVPAGAFPLAATRSGALRCASRLTDPRLLEATRGPFCPFTLR